MHNMHVHGSVSVFPYHALGARLISVLRRCAVCASPLGHAKGKADTVALHRIYTPPSFGVG